LSRGRHSLKRKGKKRKKIRKKKRYKKKSRKKKMQTEMRKKKAAFDVSFIVGTKRRFLHVVGAAFSVQCVMTSDLNVQSRPGGFYGRVN
jgi:c-di-AMP phosphodiesterase-like protein